MIKLDWQAIWASMISRNGLIIIGLALVLIFSAAYMTDCGSGWLFNRGIKKDKVAIQAEIDKAKEIQQQIANLQNTNAAVMSNIAVDTQALANQTFGLDEAKKTTNQAVANFQKAANTNANNFNATADDLKRQLDRIPDDQ